MNNPYSCKVVIIGGGLMGHAIGLEFKIHGFDVAIVELDEAGISKSKKLINETIPTIAKARNISVQHLKNNVRDLRFTTQLTSILTDARIVIETATEDFEIKRELLAKAGRYSPANCIITSNTSSFSASLLAEWSIRSDSFAITHFFNPCYLLPLVEIMPGPNTKKEVTDFLFTLFHQMDKTPMLIKKEVPGLVGNRLQNALGREAAALVDDRIATPEDVDTVVKFGFGRRLALAGPFEIWAPIGWDLVSTIASELFKEISVDKHSSSRLNSLVADGHLGLKTLIGFYRWTTQSAKAFRETLLCSLVKLDQIHRSKVFSKENVPSPVSKSRPNINRKINKKEITIVGAGLMGHGIALEFASAGHNVVINDLNPKLLREAMDRSRTGLELLVKDGRIFASEVPEVMSRITSVHELKKAVEKCDVLIEATFEDLALKQRLFRQFDQWAPNNSLLLSNTSTYLPSSLASQVSRPERVAVTHYFNPPHLLPVVEVVRGEKTSDKNVELIVNLLVSAGKKPAVVKKEIQGFIGNRLQMAMFREALNLVEAGVVSVAELDEIVKSSFGRRLAVAGPFELAEVAGLDLRLTVSENIYPTLNNSTEIPKILIDKVKNGHLGISTGKGFYDWTPDSAEELRIRIADGLSEISSWNIAEFSGKIQEE